MASNFFFFQSLFFLFFFFSLPLLKILLNVKEKTENNTKVLFYTRAPIMCTPSEAFFLGTWKRKRKRKEKEEEEKRKKET